MTPYRVAVLCSNRSLDLVIPHDGSLPFKSLVQETINRASKHSINLGGDFDLRLGSATGFLIDPDDKIHDVLTSSEILFIVAGTTSQPRDPDVAQQHSQQGFKIRVVTPLGAQRHLEARHLPLLKGGQIYDLSTTLSQLRTDVVEHLGLPSHELRKSKDNECNCTFVDQLAKRGVWHKFTCSDHLFLQCYFLDQNRQAIKGECALCSNSIASHLCSSNNGSGCGSFVLVRKDLGCGHMVHSACVNESMRSWTCPDACQTSTAPLPRELQIVVASGHSFCEQLTIQTPTRAAIMSALRNKFGEEYVNSKVIHIKGGINNDQTGMYERLPMISFCSKARHEHRATSLNLVDSTLESGPSSTQLDLHTVEGPIETSQHELTFGDTRLGDLAQGGVVSIFVVEWRSTGVLKPAIGKDGMFAANSWWRLPVEQSERGMAAALSCLRVFSHIVGDKTFDDSHYNEILRLLHVLTRFPPAIRAMHILTSGKTLRPSECAALVQSIAATLGELIPRAIIDHDNRRLLEGTRLLLGLILHRMKRAQTAKSNLNPSEKPASTNRPWIDAFHTVDLKDCRTLENVLHPVQTTLGLMERSAYAAFMDDGFLGSAAGEVVELAENPDLRALRVASLFGGVSDEVSYYDADALSKAYLQSAQLDPLASELKGFSKDLQYLAVLCEETKLSVVAPRQLASAEAPCLTLDRDGNLAVYTGQAACAPPDRDKAIYHPLTGREENIDVNIVAQMLEPILKARETDGTAIFDLCSSTFRRKDTTPSELLVVAIDISHSMNQSSDFADISDEDDIVAGQSEAQDDVVMEDQNDGPIDFSDIRGFITNHESYQDMLSIVNASNTSRLRSTAEDIVDFLRKLTSREIEYVAKSERNTRTWATSAFMLSRGHRSQKRMDDLRRTLAGLHRWEKALCDLLIFHAKDSTFQPCTFTWSYGTPVPTIQRPREMLDSVDLSESCVVPTDFICPIKQAGVFEDPVTTSDGLGPYERRSIETWLRRNNTSPLTGLQLSDKTLRRNQPLADSVKKWIEGDDIISAAPSTPKRGRGLGRGRIKLNFVSPNSTFARTVPTSLSLAGLYSVAFRGMRGVYQKFSLHVDGTVVACSNATLSDRSLRSGQQILVHADTGSEDNASGKSNWQEEMCLIKVYTAAKQSAEEVFSYWVPRNTPATLASILFKSWRFHQSSWRRTLRDCDVWLALRYSGDSSLVGEHKKSWDTLATPLDKILPSEIIQDEILCEKNDKSDSRGKGLVPLDESDPDDKKYGRYRVLKVAVLPYRSPEEDEKRERQKMRTLTRLGVTKSVFSAFINRIIAYNYSTTIGLVVFGNEAKVSQKLTDVVENFRTAIDKMEPDGDTALWDSLALAADQITEYEKKFPGVKKRILCLSDGQDTKSSKSESDVARLLVQNKIVVDSVSIGDEDNSSLRTISYLTGGYKFTPSSLEDAVAICELEPVLSQDERPPVERPHASAFLTPGGFSLASRFAQPDLVTRDIYPQPKVHPNLSDSFVRIGTFAKCAAASEGVASDSYSPSNLRNRRVLNEIRDIAMRSHPSYDVYVSEANMSFWKIVLQGPSESAYASGTFVLYLHMDESYPRQAPKGRFITRIFHPNIGKGGRVCHSIFDRNWTVDTTNKQILDTVFGLLLVPEFTDPVNTVVTLNYYWDEVAFKFEVEKHIEKFASKSRVELGKEIVGQN